MDSWEYELRQSVTVSRSQADLRTVDVLMKYARSVQKPFCLGYHDCEEHREDDDKKSGYCPHKLRSTVDNEMYRDFEQTQTLEDVTITCQGMFIVVLCLGGQECAEGNKTSLDSYMLG